MVDFHETADMVPPGSVISQNIVIFAGPLAKSLGIQKGKQFINMRLIGFSHNSN